MLSSKISEKALSLHLDMKEGVISHDRLFKPVEEPGKPWSALLQKQFKDNPELPCTPINVLMDYLAEQYGSFNRKHFRDVVKRGVKSPHWFTPTTQEEE